MGNFDRKDRERFILSTALALAFMAAVFAIFGVLDLFYIEIPDYSGPLYVSLGEAEEERVQEPAAEEAPAEQVRPESRTEPAPERAAERVAEPSPEAAAPSPEADAPVPAAPRTDTAPSEEPPETAEEAPGPEGRQDRVEERIPEVQPEQVTPRTGGDEGTAPGSEEADEPEAGIFEDDDLSSLDEAFAQADTGDTDGATDGQENGEENGEAERSIGTPENPVTLDELKARRRPINLQEPQIPPELAQGLPRILSIEISFTLEPSGSVTDLQMMGSSGNTDIDSIVREAIRKWRFERVQDSAGSVRVRVLYTITVR
ncbi:MAG: TonB family protein [Spirochaetia bacterium]